MDKPLAQQQYCGKSVERTIKRSSIPDSADAADFYSKFRYCCLQRERKIGKPGPKDYVFAQPHLLPFGQPRRAKVPTRTPCLL